MLHLISDVTAEHVEYLSEIGQRYQRKLPTCGKHPPHCILFLFMHLISDVTAEHVEYLSEIGQRYQRKLPTCGKHPPHCIDEPVGEQQTYSALSSTVLGRVVLQDSSRVRCAKLKDIRHANDTMSPYIEGMPKIDGLRIGVIIYSGLHFGIICESQTDELFSFLLEAGKKTCFLYIFEGLTSKVEATQERPCMAKDLLLPNGSVVCFSTYEGTHLCQKLQLAGLRSVVTPSDTAGKKLNDSSKEKAFLTTLMARVCASWIQECVHSSSMISDSSATSPESASNEGVHPKNCVGVHPSPHVKIWFGSPHPDIVALSLKEVGNKDMTYTTFCEVCPSAFGTRLPPWCSGNQCDKYHPPDRLIHIWGLENVVLVDKIVTETEQLGSFFPNVLLLQKNGGIGTGPYHMDPQTENDAQMEERPRYNNLSNNSNPNNVIVPCSTLDRIPLIRMMPIDAEKRSRSVSLIKFHNIEENVCLTDPKDQKNEIRLPTTNAKLDSTYCEASQFRFSANPVTSETFGNRLVRSSADRRLSKVVFPSLPNTNGKNSSKDETISNTTFEDSPCLSESTSRKANRTHLDLVAKSSDRVTTVSDALENDVIAVVSTPHSGVRRDSMFSEESSPKRDTVKLNPIDKDVAPLCNDEKDVVDETINNTTYEDSPCLSESTLKKTNRTHLDLVVKSSDRVTTVSDALEKDVIAVVSTLHSDVRSDSMLSEESSPKRDTVKLNPIDKDVAPLYHIEKDERSAVQQGEFSTNDLVTSSPIENFTTHLEEKATLRGRKRKETPPVSQSCATIEGSMTVGESPKEVPKERSHFMLLRNTSRTEVEDSTTELLQISQRKTSERKVERRQIMLSETTEDEEVLQTPKKQKILNFSSPNDEKKVMNAQSVRRTMIRKHLSEHNQEHFIPFDDDLCRLPQLSSTVFLWRNHYLSPNQSLHLEPFFDPGRANPLLTCPQDYENIAARGNISESRPRTQHSTKKSQCRKECGKMPVTRVHKGKLQQTNVHLCSAREVILINYGSSAFSVSKGEDSAIPSLVLPKDKELRDFISHVSYCCAIPTLEARARALAAEVCLRLGGRSDHNPEQFDEEAERHVLSKRINASTGAPRACVSLGTLRLGLCRHRTLLFKLLCDLFEVPCYMIRGAVHEGNDAPNTTAPDPGAIHHRHSWNVVRISAEVGPLPHRAPSHDPLTDWRLVDLMLHGPQLHPLSTLPEHYLFPHTPFLEWSRAVIAGQPLSSTQHALPARLPQHIPLPHPSPFRSLAPLALLPHPLPHNRPSPSPSPLTLERPCGYGVTGVVYKASLSGYTVAVKTMRAPRRSTTTPPSLPPALHNEYRWLHALRHSPHVISVLGVHTDATASSLYLEFRTHSLLWLLNMRREGLDLGAVLAVGLGVGAGLVGLHGLGGVHRDVKAENVLLEAYPREVRALDLPPEEGGCEIRCVQLCDFMEACEAGRTPEMDEEGWGREGRGEGEGEQGVPESSRVTGKRMVCAVTGTEPYMAPEILHNAGVQMPHLGRKGKCANPVVWQPSADIWALGVLLCEVCNLELTTSASLTKENAREGGKRRSKNERFVARTVSFTLANGKAKSIVIPQLRDPDHWPPILVEVIERCLELNPSKRITAKRVVSQLKVLKRKSALNDATSTDVPR